MRHGGYGGKRKASARNLKARVGRLAGKAEGVKSTVPKNKPKKTRRSTYR